MNNPTKQPWYVLFDKNRHQWWEILVRFPPQTPPNELQANAKLIENAPGMYDALYDLAHYADGMVTILKESHPGKAEALNMRITKAKELIEFVSGENNNVQTILPNDAKNDSN